MERFFYAVYEFLFDFKSFDVTNFLCNLQSDSLHSSLPLSSLRFCFVFSSSSAF